MAKNLKALIPLLALALMPRVAHGIGLEKGDVIFRDLNVWESGFFGGFTPSFLGHDAVYLQWQGGDPADLSTHIIIESMGDVGVRYNSVAGFQAVKPIWNETAYTKSNPTYIQRLGITNIAIQQFGKAWDFWQYKGPDTFRCDGLVEYSYEHANPPIDIVPFEPTPIDISPFQQYLLMTADVGNPPQITATGSSGQIANGGSTADPNISIYATDGNYGSGLALLEIWQGNPGSGGSLWKPPFSTEYNVDHTYTSSEIGTLPEGQIYVRAYDRGGNYTQTSFIVCGSPIPGKFTVQDDFKQEIAAGRASRTSGVTLTVACGKTVSKLALLAGGNETQPSFPVNTAAGLTWTIPELAEGSYNASVNYADSTREESRFTIDRTPPMLSIDDGLLFNDGTYIARHPVVQEQGSLYTAENPLWLHNNMSGGWQGNGVVWTAWDYYSGLKSFSVKKGGELIIGAMPDLAGYDAPLPLGTQVLEGTGYMVVAHDQLGHGVTAYFNVDNIPPVFDIKLRLKPDDMGLALYARGSVNDQVSGINPDSVKVLDLVTGIIPPQPMTAWPVHGPPKDPSHAITDMDLPQAVIGDMGGLPLTNGEGTIVATDGSGLTNSRNRFRIFSGQGNNSLVADVENGVSLSGYRVGGNGEWIVVGSSMPSVFLAGRNGTLLRSLRLCGTGTIYFRPTEGAGTVELNGFTITNDSLAGELVYQGSVFEGCWFDPPEKIIGVPPNLGKSFEFRVVGQLSGFIYYQNVSVDPQETPWAPPPLVAGVDSKWKYRGSTITVRMPTVEPGSSNWLGLADMPISVPQGYALLPGERPVAPYLYTPAVYQGPVSVMVDYDFTQLTPDQQSRVRMLYLENGTWRDVTTSVDAESGQVFGQTSKLGIYGLFLAVGSQGTGRLAAALDPSGQLWKIEFDQGTLGIARYNPTGDREYSAALPDAPLEGDWNMSFDAAGTAYALMTSVSSAAVYQVSPQGALALTAYPPLAGQVTAMDADGTHLWIATSSGSLSTLWLADGQDMRPAAPAVTGRMNAIRSEGSGVVWLAGADGEAALWRYDAANGTMARLDWINTLGGSGSSAHALLRDPDGNIWLGGWARGWSKTVAALWMWDGSGIFLAASSTGAYSEQAQSLQLDAAGRFWLSGIAQLDAAGNSRLALWQFPVAGTSGLGLAGYYDESRAALAVNVGMRLAISNPNLYILAMQADGSFAVRNRMLGLAGLAGILNYAPGFSGGNVFFLAGASPDLSDAQALGPVPAPVGTTTFAYALNDLAAPSTYYFAAVYDLSGSIALGGEPSPMDPVANLGPDPIYLRTGTVTAPEAALAVDQQVPSVAILAPVAGSTITAALFRLSGTAADNVGVTVVRVAVQDMDAGTWWDTGTGAFITVQGPLWADAIRSGSMNSVSWSAPKPAVSDGKTYAVYAEVSDFMGNVAATTAVVLTRTPVPTTEPGFAVALERDDAGFIWTVARDTDTEGTVSMSLRKHDSAGILQSSMTLPSAADPGRFGIDFDPTGNVWVGGTSSSGLMVWKVSATNGEVISSAIYPASNGPITTGGVAVDAAGSAWVAGAERISQAPAFRYALWKYASDAFLAAGFPKGYQRPSGVLDVGFTTDKDASGNIWSAGVSSDPATGRLDLAVWKHGPDGMLASGFPAFWPRTFASFQSNTNMKLKVGPDGGAWVATLKTYPGCAAADLALLHFGPDGALLSQSLWHNSEGTSVSGRGLDFDPAGNVWIVGRSANTPVVWKFRPSGALMSGYPRMDIAPFKNDLIMVDGAGTPWVVDPILPRIFSGGVTVPGGSGPNSCALQGMATISGTITKPAGFSAGTDVTVVYSSTAFESEPQFLPLVAAEGTSVEYSLNLPSPATYWLGAVEDFTGSMSTMTVIGFYGNLTGLQVVGGSAVTGADFSIGLDTVPPVATIDSILNGSTLTALSSVQGTVRDNLALDPVVHLAAQDLFNGLWWDGPTGQWAESGEPLYQRFGSGGVRVSAQWSVSVSSDPAAAGENFGGLGRYFTPGHSYRFLALTQDQVGNLSQQPAVVSFTWQTACSTCQAYVEDLLPPRTTLSVGLPNYSGGLLYATHVTTFGLVAFDDLLSAGDALGSGVAQAWLAVDSLQYFAYSSTFTLAGEGHHTIAFFSVDKAGHAEQPRSVAVDLDLTAPMTEFEVLGSSVTNPEGDLITIEPSAQIALSAQDPFRNDTASGLKGIYYVVDADPLSSECAGVEPSTSAPAGTCANPAYAGPFELATGTHTLYYFAEDLVGNRDELHSIAILAGPPPAPAGVSGVALSTLAIQFNWPLVEGATGYTVYRSTSGPKVTSVTSNFIIQGTTVPNTPRTRCVAAANEYGEGPMKCYGPVYTLAAAPSQLHAVAVSSDSITWAWDASDNPGWTVYGMALSTDAFTTNFSTPLPFSMYYTGTSFAVSGLAPDTLYYAGVRAINANFIRTAAVFASTQTLSGLPALAMSPSTGPIGIPFTISGTGFGTYDGSNTRVRFGAGGPLAPLSLWNDTTITGTVPGLAPGSYALAIERQAGSTLTVVSAGSFAVLMPQISTYTPLSGPIGTPFTLTGSAFGPYAGSRTRVLIGGVAAPLSLWNDTTITGTVPGAVLPGVQPLVAERTTADGGLVASATVYFEVTVPSITVVVPTSGPIGITLTVTGTSFGPYAGSLTRLLIGGATAPLSVWNDTQIVGTVPGLAPEGQVSVIVERATSGGGLVRSNTAYFEVTALQTAAISPSAGPIGIPFTITGTSFGAYNGSNTRVRFGESGPLAPLSVWNDTTITGTVPGLLPGEYAVLVERQQGEIVAVSTAGVFTVSLPQVSAFTPVSGPIGVPFTITGASFGPYNGSTTRVKIGGMTASLSVWNDTTITGTIPGLPAGTQPVVVERTTSDGALAQSGTFYFEVTVPSVASVSPLSGPIGTAFTLTGTSFGSYNGSNTKVTVGGYAASLSVWNDTTITGTIPGAVPTGEQAVVVERITSDGGLIQSATVYFSVTGPLMGALNPSTGPIGIPFTITGTNFGAYNGSNTRVKFGEVIAPLSVWSDTSITGTVPGLSSGTYEVAVERQEGSAVSRSMAASFTATLPQVTGMTPVSGPIGTPFTITGTSFGPYNGSNTRVKIGGVAASLSLWNDTTITGTIPSLEPGSHAAVLERATADGGLMQSGTSYFEVVLPAIATLTPSSAPIGAPFTITGTGFGPYAGSLTKVLVAGVAAPLSVWNDTTITGRVPGTVAGGQTTLTVQRTTSGGGLAEATTDFLVIMPQITQLAPTSGQPGDAFEIQGTGFGPYNGSATKVTFSGTAAALSLWTNTVIRGLVPAGLAVGTYTVVAVLSPSGGTVESNAAVYGVGTEGMGVLGMSADLQAPRPEWYYEASLALPSEEGGKVTAPSHASVVVPPLALQTTTTLTIDRGAVEGVQSESRLKALSAVSLAAAGEPVKFGPEGTRFSVPVTIELPYNPAAIQLGQDGKVAVHYWDPGTKTWTPLPSEVDPVRRVVRARTDHFSLYQPLLPGDYAVAAAVASDTVATIRVACNPLRQTCQPMRFQGLPVDARLRIYTLSGALVKDMGVDGQGQAAWNGTNQSGATVASGVYFVFVQGSGSSKTIKIAVER